MHGHFWVPIDDVNCWAWSFDYKVTRPLSDRERKAMEAGQGIHVSYVPGTYIPAANKTNDYLVDRIAQKEGRTYSGVFGIAMQDASLQESMGPIVDRTKENLVSTDNGIIMARHRLLRALKVMEKGDTPPGIVREHQHVRSAAVGIAISGLTSGAKCDGGISSRFLLATGAEGWHVMGPHRQERNLISCYDLNGLIN